MGGKRGRERRRNDPLLSLINTHWLLGMALYPMEDEYTTQEDPSLLF